MGIIFSFECPSPSYFLSTTSICFGSSTSILGRSILMMTVPVTFPWGPVPHSSPAWWP
jgi:hypothetical protein